MEFRTILSLFDWALSQQSSNLGMHAPVSYLGVTIFALGITCYVTVDFANTRQERLQLLVLSSLEIWWYWVYHLDANIKYMSRYNEVC